MSTKVSEISQLFANQTIEGNKKEQVQSTSVQFSSLLNQSAGQSTENFAKQLSTSNVSDYAQYQRKETSIKEVQPVTLEEKVSKIEDNISEYESAVKEVLKEELGVSEEEIEQAMESLGLQYADLSNQTNLIQLVSELTGENMTDLLYNEAFVNVMQSVSNLTEELLQTLGMDLEEFTDICQQILYQAEGSEESVQNVFEDQAGMTAEFETEVQADMLSGELVGENQNSEGVLVDENVTMTEDTTTVLVQENETKTVENTVMTTVVKEETAQETDGSNEQQLETTYSSEEITTVTEKEDAENSSNQQQNQQQNTKDSSQNTLVFATQENQTQTVQTTQNTFVQTYQQTIDVQDVMEQIVQSARLLTSNSSTTMEMQLNPENLGKIYMEISTKEGIVSAKLVAQNESVREALQAQVAELKQSLNQAGVKVNAVEVTVSSHEFERNLEQNQQQEEQLAEKREEQEQSGDRRRRNLNLNSLDELSGVMSEEETLIAQMMQDNGNTMDVKA